jgi:hypothetical protein
MVLGGGRSVAKANTRVDWERGLLIASAAAPADLRSPTTDLARVKAERVATKRCSALLRAAAAALPMASGKTVGAVLGNSLADASIGLISLATDHGSDGSVVVTMALPIDRLRTLRFGSDSPVTVSAGQDSGANAPLFVDARSSKIVPSVGLGITLGTATYRGPVVFYSDEVAARAGARLGNDLPLQKAKGLKAGVLTLAGSADADSADADIAGAPLVVVLYSESR